VYINVTDGMPHSGYQMICTYSSPVMINAIKLNLKKDMIE